MGSKCSAPWCHAILALNFAFATVIVSPPVALAQAKKSVASAIAGMRSTPYWMTMLDKALIDVNIRRAYSRSDKWTGKPVEFDSSATLFTTHYFVPSHSPLLAMSSKDMLSELEVEINGLALDLITSLGLFETQYEELRKSLKVEFITYEEKEFYIIGLFEGGKLRLTRERVKTR